MPLGNICICIGNDGEIHERLRRGVPTGVRKLLLRGSHDKKSPSGTTNMTGISFVTASH